MGKYTKKFNEGLKLLAKGYKREQYQSFMTTPEWFNVEISAHFGDFLKNGHSMFQFPYFRQVYEMWRVFFLSYRNARKYNTAYEILSSDYMVMDLFVVLFTTFELIPKGMISLLFYPFLSKKNQTEMQQYLAEYFEFYAKDIETKPFFMHDYEKYIHDLTEKYQQCRHRTWTDWWTWTILSWELKGKNFLSRFLRKSYVEEPSTTDVLVKFKVDAATSEEAIQQFKTKINELDSFYDVHIVDNQVYTKEKSFNKSYCSVYARLTAPRYMPFRQAVSELAERGIHIKNIAGQNYVQVKCDLSAKDEATLKSYQSQLFKTAHVTPLYTYSDGIHSNRKICLFNVPAKNLDKVLDSLEDHPGTKISFIHNF